MPQENLAQHIGVFDSGVGGLSILQALRRELPGESFLYFADQAHVPYGRRSLADVRRLAFGIAHYFLEENVKMIVVACNTASAAALHGLREAFPGVPFVGMEPAVKPAAEFTSSKVIGVLATPATFSGELYNSVVARFAEGVTILQHTLPGMVERIESGRIETQETRAMLQEAIEPMLDQGADAIVLGCTHYPFLIPMLRSLVGDGVRVINPAPAVARQARRVLAQADALAPDDRHGHMRYATSGGVPLFASQLKHLIDERGAIEGLTWEGDRLRRRA